MLPESHLAKQLSYFQPSVTNIILKCNENIFKFDGC